MKSVAALTAAFAVGAFAIPSAHHHEHLHRRHAEADPQVVEYVTQIATVSTVVTQGGALPPTAAPTTAPQGPPQGYGPPQDHGPQGYGGQHHGGGGPPGQFATVVTADDGQQVSAMAWKWGDDNGPHGYSWTYQQPDSQPTQAPASAPAPAPGSAPAPGPAPAPAPAPSDNSGLTAQQKKIVDTHNLHRANHSVPDLQWGAGLASAAQTVANACSFTHDTKTGLDGCGFESQGQNYACVGGSASEDVSKDISGQWYGEEGVYAMSGSYGLANPIDTTTETGHFTQVVWKSTTHVGCGLANCPNGVAGTKGMDSLFVCNYGPAGNYGGEYAENVPKPTKNQAPVAGTSY